MDGLALLCTLHANGPATLKRLRSAGCADLEAFLARPAEELARLLDVTPAHARRLHREAGLLRERVANGLLQDEESIPTATAAAAAEEDRESQDASGLSTVDRAILGRVLETWRARDAVESGAVPTEAAAEESAVVPAHGRGIQPDVVTGLSAEIVGRLAALGIDTLPDLASAESIALARELAIPFSELRRLQFLAARALDSGAQPSKPFPPVPAAPPRPDHPSEPVPDDLPFGAGVDASGAKIPVRASHESEHTESHRTFEIPRRVRESVVEPESSGGPFV